jgi:hypothetical protein
MTPNEKAFFEEKIKTNNFSMPKRCLECRHKKREGKRVEIPNVLAALSNIKRKALSDDFTYAFNEDDLAQEIQDIIDSLILFQKQNRHLLRTNG